MDFFIKEFSGSIAISAKDGFEFSRFAVGHFSNES